MGRAAKVQSFFESAMTDFTEQLHIETLWGRYQSEGVSKGVSISQYFEANGIPFHVFEKWYKKRFRQPDVVDCVVDGVPDDAMAEKNDTIQSA